MATWLLAVGGIVKNKKYLFTINNLFIFIINKKKISINEMIYYNLKSFTGRNPIVYKK